MTKPVKAREVGKRASLSVVIFVTVAMALFRVSRQAADKILLLFVYGWHRLLAEHLTIVKEKPALTVSNGDVLYGKGFEHYLLGVSMWIVSTFVLIRMTYRLLPRREREALNGRYTVSVPATMIMIVLFFAIAMLPLALSLFLAVLVVTIGLLLPWVRNEIQRSR